MKKVYIETNGCAVLRHETQRYAKFFRENGWKEVGSPKVADIILMTGCGVVDWTEDYAIESIKRLVKVALPGSKILVGGCIPKINPKRVVDIKKDMILFGPRESEILNDIIGAGKPISEVFYNCGQQRTHSFGDPNISYERDEIEQGKIVKFFSQKFKTDKFQEIYDYLTRGRHFWREEKIFEIKVASGCANNCSYCATKLAIGNFQSEDETKIVNQVKGGITAGYKKILFIGDEVGYYGVDRKTSLTELIDKIDNLRGDFKIALRYIDPVSLINNYQGLKKYFKSGRIYFFCSALQSGSPRILKLMNRKSYINKLIGIIRDINENYPHVYKHTQIIVGFPTETIDDFNKTLDVLRKCDFDYITITAYKDRPGTKSRLLGGHLSEQEIDRRFEEAVFYGRENRNKQFWKRIQKELSYNVKK